MSHEFDSYADDYQQLVQKSIDFSGIDHSEFVKMKYNHISNYCQKNSIPNDAKLLDVGCGVGSLEHYLSKRFTNLHAIEPSLGSLDKAKIHLPNVQFHHAEATKLPFNDNSFDLVFTVCVMHHIKPEQWDKTLSEMQRVLKPGGSLLIFEHNPYNPLTRKAVNDCPFDKDAVLLHPYSLKSRLKRLNYKNSAINFIAFTPKASNFFHSIDLLFHWLPVGGQYYASAKKGE